jgi:integrase
VNVTATRIKAVIDGCRFTTLRGINLPDVEHWLAEQRTAEAFGIKTSNEYGMVVRQWLAWLVDNGRAETNPLTRFKKLTDTDEKRERRALSSDEFSRLVATTLAASRYRNQISGIDRAMLYLVAAFTGLRVSELKSLTPESFDLVAGIVVVEAKRSKRRRLERQPLPPALCDRLRDWLPGRTGKLWPGSWSNHAALMLQGDLSLAGIPYVDGNGVADFHSLRHTFCTNLALANVPPKVTQSLARHSTIELTLGTYAHVQDSDAMAGLAKLPAVPSLTLPLTHRQVTTGHDLAQRGTTLDSKSQPESGGFRPPKGYLPQIQPICYGSSKEVRRRLETCATLRRFPLWRALIELHQRNCR